MKVPLSEETKSKISTALKGHVHSEETKKKISQTLRGKKHTEERKRNISKAKIGKPGSWQGRKHSKASKEKMSVASKGRNVGEKSYWWRGGITSINQIIRHSVEYKLWREAVFKRDKYTCIWCGQTGGTLHADHIKPFSLFPELRFAIDNGRTLCINCHRTTDTYGRR
jgi:5-methylcytosine-specific restriction endonuclease McrA